MSMADDIRDLQRIVSELCRNTAGLPVRLASGGGGGGDTSLMTSNYLILFEAMDGATGDQDDLTAAAALAQPYALGWDGVKFTRVKTGDPITIWNFDTCQEYEAGTAVWCATIENLTIEGAPDSMTEIVAVACCQVAEGA